MPLAGTGRVAFPIILGIAAVIGVTTYFIFTQVTPGHNLFTSARFFQSFPTSPASRESNESGGATTTAGDSNNGTDQQQIPENAVVIDISEGAAVQGNPYYLPDNAEAETDSTVTWKNGDSVPHTATSGTGVDDPNVGKTFDSGPIDPGDNYSLPPKKMDPGEHQYFCQIHPYMKGQITIG